MGTFPFEHFKWYFPPLSQHTSAIPTGSCPPLFGKKWPKVPAVPQHLGRCSLPGELVSWRLRCANFFFRACAMIEAGSVASAVIGGFLTGVPPGDLKLILVSLLASAFYCSPWILSRFLQFSIECSLTASTWFIDFCLANCVINEGCVGKH